MTHRLVCIGTALALAAACRAGELRLEHGDWHYTIDDAAGNVAGGRRGEGPFLQAAFDHYRLVTADRTIASDESKDRVVENRPPAGDTPLALVCENQELGLTITKRYWIEGATGTLFKSIEFAAREGTTGQLWFESGVEVPAEWWRDGAIWEPVMHSVALPFYPTAGIRELTNLAPNNGCRAVVMLHQPRQGSTLVHWRWGGEQFEFFWVIGEEPDYGKRVWPRRWLLGSQERLVGGPSRQTVTIRMAYGLHAGSPLDFLLAYAQRPEYRELVSGLFPESPAWILDTIVDEHWDTSYLDHGYEGLLREVLEKKLPFGNIMTTMWGAFPYENYTATPEDREEGDADPAETASLMARMKAISPRVKAGLYTHYGSPTAKYGTRLHGLAREQGWLTHDRAGQVVTHRTDYNMADERAAVALTRAAPGFRDLLVRRFDELFGHLNVDFVYMDATPSVGRYDFDWQTWGAPAARTIQELYNRFLEIAVRHGGAVTMNYPVAVGNHAGLTEWPWFPVYQRNWRHFAGRLAQQQALNVAGRRLYLAGFIMPAGTPKEESIRLHLNYTRTLALGLGMLDVKQVEFKRDLYVQGAPYIQAAHEIRNRALVDADLTPSWVEDPRVETEAYAWRMAADYGLITVLNHDAEQKKETIAFDTKPLGLRPGRPGWVWRLEMADPREVDFTPDTMDSPVRRLARQELLLAGVPLPARLSLELDLPSENPVELVLTASPAVVAAVDDRPCQYWLPAACGVSTSGTVSPSNDQINVMVTNPGASAELLIVLGESMAKEPQVQQRRWGEHIAAGVAVGFSEIAHEVVELGGRRLLKVKVGAGDTEIAVR